MLRPPWLLPLLLVCRLLVRLLWLVVVHRWQLRLLTLLLLLPLLLLVCMLLLWLVVVVHRRLLMLLLLWLVLCWLRATVCIRFSLKAPLRY
jgi:hypothetical protein